MPPTNASPATRVSVLMGLRMRVFPIIAAITVSALIYGAVFERERLLALLPDTGSGEGARASDAASSTNADDAPNAAGSPEASQATVGVVAVRSTATEIDSTVIVRGRTEADRQVDLRAETSGLVVSEPIRRGAVVDKGDVLCRLDPGPREAALNEASARERQARAGVPEAKARVEEAKAQREEARINYRAADELIASGFASETRVAATRAALRSAEASVEAARAGLETAQSQITAAQAAVVAAEEEIERLTIAAPFGGALESDTAELGSLMQPGTLCATLLRLDPIVITGFVSETQVRRVTLEARARARLASGREAAGKVTFVSRQADPATRTFRVDIRLPNKDLAIRDGETAEIRISAQGKMAHLLPQSALTLSDDGTLGVRLVDDDNRARFHAVTLLRDSPEGVWLTGPPRQAAVIVIGQEYVADGVTVAPDFRDRDAPALDGTGAADVDAVPTAAAEPGQ